MEQITRLAWLGVVPILASLVGCSVPNDSVADVLLRNDGEAHGRIVMQYDHGRPAMFGQCPLAMELWVVQQRTEIIWLAQDQRYGVCAEIWPWPPPRASANVPFEERVVVGRRTILLDMQSANQLSRIFRELDRTTIGTNARETVRSFSPCRAIVPSWPLDGGPNTDFIMARTEGTHWLTAYFLIEPEDAACQRKKSEVIGNIRSTLIQLHSDLPIDAQLPAGTRLYSNPY